MPNDSFRMLTPDGDEIFISKESMALLRYLAVSQGISRDQALERAILTEAYMQQERSEGSTILIQKGGTKELKEVIFKD
jgi:hypothetical protein